MKKFSTGMVLVAALLLAGCSAAPHHDSARTPKPADPTPSLAPEITGAYPAVASCTDPTGDGGAADIQSVTLTRSGNNLDIAFALTAIPKYTTDADLIVTFYDKTGNHGGIFTTEWLQGQQNAQVSVFDNDKTKNTNLSIQPYLVDNSTIVTDYPATLIDPLGDGWIWKAVTSIDGNDVDSCSGGAP